MAIKVNLLPTNYGVSAPLAKLLKSLRSINIILLGLFIAFVTGIGAFLIYTSVQIGNLKEEEDLYKSQIAALQQSEQQLVLLKDRLEKISTLKSVANALINLEMVEPLIINTSGGTTLTELDLNSRKTDISLLFKSNSELSNFFSSIVNSTTFKTVVLSSFGFNPTGGYLVSINLSS